MVGEAALLSLSRVKKIISREFFPVKPDIYDMCINGCMMYYPGVVGDKCFNSLFGEKRFNSEGEPRAVTEQISLIQQLSHLFDSPKFRQLIKYSESRHSDFFTRRDDNPVGSMFEDFFDGSAQSLCQKSGTSDFHIQLAMYTDGFNPFKRGGMSMTMVMFVIMDLPPEVR